MPKPKKNERFRRQRHRRRRIVDPAFAVFLRLLAWLLLLVGLAPRPPSRGRPAAAAPSPSPGGNGHELSRDDWSPAQHEREHGGGGAFPVLSVSGHMAMHAAGHGRYRVSPTYRRLVADLRRPVARDDAARLLRRRLPSEAHEWLDGVISRQEWSALSWCVRPGETDVETETAMLRAAVDWTEARRGDAGPTGDGPNGDGPNGDGPNGPGTRKP